MRWRIGSVGLGRRVEALGLIGGIEQFPGLGDEMALQAKQHVIRTVVLGPSLESTVHLTVQGHEVVLGEDVQDVDATAGFEYFDGSFGEYAPRPFALEVAPTILALTD
jgi:hypothetical protein